MALVWPTVPTEIAGERVYHATDLASFAAIHGSFLLGGRFTKPSVMPPCPASVGESDAELQLIPYCYLLNIDGLELAPKSSIDEPNNEIVVARVHVNDPLAAQCPDKSRSDCEASIVVESVVWRSDELIKAIPSSASSTSLPVPPASGGASAAIPSAVPSPIGGSGVGPSAGASAGSPLRSPGVITAPSPPMRPSKSSDASSTAGA
jgi:hypothetical protein